MKVYSLSYIMLVKIKGWGLNFEDRLVIIGVKNIVRIFILVVVWFEMVVV